MHQVADNVFGIGSSGHNFYLVRDGDEATLIDAGCSREWRRLVSTLDALEIPLESLRGVVATHAHSDHFGLATRASTNGIDVRVHTDEVARATGTYRGRFSATTKDLPMFRYHTLKNMLPMVFAGVMKLDHPESVGTFSDGEVLDLPGNPRVIHTPGHTEGHVMFHCPDRGALFTGDGLATMDLTGSGTGPQMIGEVFDLDHEQAFASLDRITDVDANVLFPGHGKPFKGSPADAVATIRGLA